MAGNANSGRRAKVMAQAKVDKLFKGRGTLGDPAELRGLMIAAVKMMLVGEIPESKFALLSKWAPSIHRIGLEDRVEKRVKRVDRIHAEQKKLRKAGPDPRARDVGPPDDDLNPPDDDLNPPETAPPPGPGREEDKE